MINLLSDLYRVKCKNHIIIEKVHYILFVISAYLYSAKLRYISNAHKINMLLKYIKIELRKLLL